MRVQRLEQPWTLSCGMTVVILDDAAGESRHDHVAFLKLYDSRWAKTVREESDAEEWTRDTEAALSDFIQTGRAATFLDSVKRDEDLGDRQDTWSSAEREAFLLYKMYSLYVAETTAYEALQDYQGKAVPRLLAKVRLDLLPLVEQGEKIRQCMQVSGILLQFLPGFTLSLLEQHAQREAWQEIVDEAVRITRLLGDVNLLNKDVRPANFIVVPPKTDDGYRVFTIDFGQSRLRRPEESDAEWGRAKWQQDEEGAIGMVMRKRLGELGFEYKFEHSMRYFEWAPGEDDE